jgi:RimJ/RimL family protein N-acetyltransferase
MTEAPFLVGHTIGLRLPTDDDVMAGRWHTWYNDLGTTRFNRHGIYPLSPQQELDFVQQARAWRDAIHLCIVELESGRLIGNAALQHIDLINRHCRIALMVGEAAGPTVGVETYGLLVEHAFCRLNLNRVADSTHAKLNKFVDMLGVLGFEPEGRGRAVFLRDGEFSDAIYFGVLAERFFELRASRGGNILFADADQLMAAILDHVRSPRKSERV